METIKFENLEMFAPFALAVVDYLASQNAVYLEQHLHIYKSDAHKKADIFMLLVALKVGQSLTLYSITEKPRYKVTCIENPFATRDAKRTGYAVEVID